MNCDFCQDQDVKSRIVLENDLAFAFVTHIPLTPGHTIICPVRHMQKYEELADAEKAAIEDLRLQIRAALIKTYQAEGFNYAWNENEVAGQSVPHLHLHVVPRNPDDKNKLQYEPREFLYGSVPRAKTSHEELAEMVEKIKQNL